MEGYYSGHQPAVTGSKSKLGRTFAKVMHIRAMSHEKAKSKKGTAKKLQLNSWEDGEEAGREKLAIEAFTAKLFASISGIKAAYAQLQHAQSPYDPDAIHAADQTVVSELKSLSELKQCYLKKQTEDPFPDRTLVLAEIKEQNCILRVYEIKAKKLESQARLKDSELTFLREKLDDARKENKMMERRLSLSLKKSSGQVPDFIAALHQATKSIRSFVRVLVTEMEVSGWDLDVAASAVVPGLTFWHPTHKCYAFESFVCREMFDGFDSDFAKFCCDKYLRLVHPRMEQSLFGSLEQRSLVKSGEFPETGFFSAFAEMASRVWALHCPSASVFQVSRGSRFSEVYMESVTEEALVSPETEPRVAFTVVPGFVIGKTVIQCQVYLR